MFQVAIDGPAGAGKSTISKMVAKEVSFEYIDTGAMYRGIAYYTVKNNIDLETTDFSFLKDITLEFKNNILHLNGESVEEFIRTPEVSSLTSKVASVKEVRVALLDQQRELGKGEVVMDGRDIGTHILPNAQVKIYLTASVETRAKRRHLEYLNKGKESDINDVIKEVEQRDYDDMNRELNPLTQAKDAILVDTSNMSIKETVQDLVDIINSKR